MSEHVCLDSIARPGPAVLAWLRPGVSENWEGLVEAGDILNGFEGFPVVARATVLEVEP